MTFCPEHTKRDQTPKFTPLSEMTSITVHSIWEFPAPGLVTVDVTLNSPCLTREYKGESNSLSGFSRTPALLYIDQKQPFHSQSNDHLNER